MCLTTERVVSLVWQINLPTVWYVLKRVFFCYKMRRVLGFSSVEFCELKRVKEQSCKRIKVRLAFGKVGLIGLFTCIAQSFDLISC